MHPDKETPLGDEGEERGESKDKTLLPGASDSSLSPVFSRSVTMDSSEREMRCAFPLGFPPDALCRQERKRRQEHRAQST